MALIRLPIKGYGQLELNNVFFRREGAIEAQCALDPNSFAVEGEATTKDAAEGKIYCENGMLLAVDKAAGLIKLPSGDDEVLPIALVYSTEHMYDERKKGLKDFYLPAGTFYPRMGYPKIGEIWTSNCFSVEESELEAIESADTVYGTFCANGAVKLSATMPNTKLVLKMVKKTTMPDGTEAAKLQVIKA